VIPTPAADCKHPTREHQHDCHIGQRIGEASHPGPHGSRTTARRRFQKRHQQHHQQHQSDDTLRAIMSLLLQLMQLLAPGIPQAASLAKMVGSLVNSTTEPPTPKPKQPKQAKGKRTSTEPDNWHHTPGKGAGAIPAPSTEPPPGHHTPGKGPTSTEPQQWQHTQAPQHPITADEVHGRDWVTVTRRRPNLDQWTLRSKDWSDPIIQYNDLGTALSKHTDGSPFRAVIQCADEDQGQAAAAMLNNTTPKAVWLIWRLATGTTTIPGQCGTKPVLQRVRCHKLVDQGQREPALLRCTQQAITTTTKHTETLRVIFDEQYISNKTRTTALARPRKALGDWIQTLPTTAAAAIQDTWGWKQHAQGPHKSIIGLIRVEGTFGQSDAPDTILGRSGQQGIFVEPIHWHHPLPPIKVAWEKWQPTDTADDYIQRLLDKGHKWGLARSARGLGARVATEASTDKTRTWQLDQAPRAWNQHTVEQLISSQPAFTDTHIIRKQVRGKVTTWWFTATSAADLDLHPIFATIDDEIYELWAKLAPPTRKAEPARSWHIHDTSTMQWHAPPKPRGTHAGTSKGTITVETPDPDDANKPSEQPQKKQCVASRPVPDGLTKVAMPADGSCLFHSIAQALTDSTGKEILGIQTRAETLAHIHKRTDTYIDLWDGLMPDDSKAPSFAAYIDHMQKHTAWGGYLELTAAARHYNQRIFIIPESIRRNHVLPRQPQSHGQHHFVVHGHTLRLPTTKRQHPRSHHHPARQTQTRTSRRRTIHTHRVDQPGHTHTAAAPAITATVFTGDRTQATAAADLDDLDHIASDLPAAARPKRPRPPPRTPDTSSFFDDNRVHWQRRRSTPQQQQQSKSSASPTNSPSLCRTRQ